MKNIKKIIFGILKFIFKSTFYACFALGAFYFVGVIFFLNGISDFDFEIFSNANPEELKLMLRVMIQAFYILGIIFTAFEYGYKYLSKPCKISFHKLKPTGKVKEVKKGESNE